MRSVLAIALITVSTGPVLALDCGTEITHDIVLEADLDCRTGVDALVVTGDGVTIDLNGHTIRGGGIDASILVEDAVGVTVHGPGRIEGAGIGVEALRARGLRVHDVAFRNVGDGVRLVNASRGEIRGNRFEGVAGHAVVVLGLPYALSRGGGHAIEDNRIVDSEYGVLIDGVRGSHVAGNHFDRIGTFAIDADPWTHQLEGNHVGAVGVAAMVD